jgi:DNA repair photolyase
MSLNKSKGNMYTHVDYTWNPIRGCKHGCIYCYVNSIPYYDQTPRYVEKCLSDKLGEGRTIFVCSTGDMFGEWVPAKWIEAVLSYCHRFPHNTYLFQSKNPGRFLEFLNHFPMHTLFGTTIETDKNTKSMSSTGISYSQAPIPLDRMNAMVNLDSQYDKMISIEPIMDFDVDTMLKWIHATDPKFVSIGADSKGHKLPEPSAAKVQRLMTGLGAIEVKLKSNLKRLGVW